MGNTFVMAANQFDLQLQQYWPKLTDEQKGLLLFIIESFMRSGDDTDGIAQYNKDLEQALQRIEAGNFVPHEQVKEMLKKRKK